MEKNIQNLVDKHYLRAVSFLVVLILIGAGYWGLRKFNPSLFLGKPDFIAVPHDEQSEQKKELSPEEKPELLNINTATAEELQTLPGIGPSMSQRIIQHRKEHGSFTSVDELTEVKGIGEKTLDKLKPYVGVE